MTTAGETVWSALAAAGPLDDEQVELVRLARSLHVAEVAPPLGLLGHPDAEARWWWAQGRLTLDDAMQFDLRGAPELFVVLGQRAAAHAIRAARACGPGSAIAAEVNLAAADIVLAVGERAPQAFGASLETVVSEVERMCAALAQGPAAQRRVRLIPMTVAAGAPLSAALVVVAEAVDLLDGTVEPAFCRAAREMARLMAYHGDDERALALLVRAEDGLGRLRAEVVVDAAPSWVVDAVEQIGAGASLADLDLGLDRRPHDEAAAGWKAVQASAEIEWEARALVVERATVLLQLGRATEAVQVLGDLAGGGAGGSFVPDALLLRALARAEAGDAAGAQGDLDAAVSDGAGTLSPSLLAMARGMVAALQDRFERAEVELEQATHLDPRPGMRSRCWSRRAALRLRRGDRAAALHAYGNLVAAVVEERRGDLGHRLDSTSLRRHASDLAAAVATAADAGDARGALWFVEAVKARALHSVLADRTRAPRVGDGRLVEVEREIDALEVAGSSMDPAVRARHLTALKLERAASIERGEWSDGRDRLAPPVAPPVDDIVAELAQRDLAALDLHYDPATARLTAIALRGGSGTVASHQLTPGTVQALLERVQAMRSTSPDRLLFDPSSHPALSFEQLVPDAVRSTLDGAPALVISPHGMLHLVPWAGLEWGGRRLLERSAVSLAPGLWALTLLAPATTPSGISTFGSPVHAPATGLDDLSGAADELVQVTALFAAAGLPAPEPIVGAGATEAAFRSLAPSAPGSPGRCLHVACHAVTGSDGRILGRPFLDGPDDPLAAGLVLTEGLVTADEIRRLRLPFTEVVLSACSTGWRPHAVGGIELLGDAALGLVAAFMEAGASSIVASTPLVDDDVAPALMVAYHQARLAGRRPAEALAAAQVEALEGGVAPEKVVGFAVHGA